MLGPLLFLIHINDVTSNVNCKSHLYADDTVLLTADQFNSIQFNFIRKIQVFTMHDKSVKKGTCILRDPSKALLI